MIELDFKKQNGLIPAIIQDYQTNEVLMLGYMNEESFQLTLKTGRVHYYSRSRNKLWIKGETSGNIQVVKSLYVDCDDDTVLIKVDQIGGAACHLGYKSCFFREIESDGSTKIIANQVFDPAEKYKE